MSQIAPRTRPLLGSIRLSRVEEFYGNTIALVALGTVFNPGLSAGDIALLFVGNLLLTILAFAINDVEDANLAAIVVECACLVRWLRLRASPGVEQRITINLVIMHIAACLGPYWHGDPFARWGVGSIHVRRTIRCPLGCIRRTAIETAETATRISLKKGDASPKWSCRNVAPRNPRH
jgi:hypothetical protein